VSIGLSSNLWQVQYEYSRTGWNNNGDILKQTVKAPSMSDIVTAYSYDQANRLLVSAELPSNAAAPACNSASDVASNGWCHKYGYDIYGNRAIASRVNDGRGATEPATFTASTNRIADSGWGYGSRGEITLDPAARRYAFDGESRMVMVCPNESSCSTTWQSGRTQYVYDGDGRRVRQRDSGGGETLYVYDAAGQLAADYATSPPAGVSGTRYLTADHLGSTRVVTDSAGAVAARYDYQPFGVEITVSVTCSPKTLPKQGTI